MNGDLQEAVNIIKTELQVLKALFEQYQNNHDNRSIERYKEINKKLTKLDELPCEKHIGIVTGFKWHLGVIWTLIFFTIGLIIKIHLL